MSEILATQKVGYKKFSEIKYTKEEMAEREAKCKVEENEEYKELRTATQLLLNTIKTEHLSPSVYENYTVESYLSPFILKFYQQLMDAKEQKNNKGEPKDERGSYFLKLKRAMEFLEVSNNKESNTKIPITVQLDLNTIMHLLTIANWKKISLDEQIRIALGHGAYFEGAEVVDDGKEKCVAEHEHWKKPANERSRSVYGMHQLDDGSTVITQGETDPSKE